MTLSRGIYTEKKKKQQKMGQPHGKTMLKWNGPKPETKKKNPLNDEINQRQPKKSNKNNSNRSGNIPAKFHYKLN